MDIKKYLSVGDLTKSYLDKNETTVYKKELKDFKFQIKRTHQYVNEYNKNKKILFVPENYHQIAKKLGLKPRRKGKPSLVLKNETALELGSPDTESYYMVLWTKEKNLVNNGKITLIGDDFIDISGYGYGFSVMVLVELDENIEVDNFLLENTLFLFNRLEGYMTRSIPGKLWIRL